MFDFIKILFVGSRPFLVFLVVFCFVFVSVFIESQKKAGGDIEIVFFDTKGESSLIKLVKNKNVLIDSAETAEVVGKIKNNLPFWDKTIDVIIISHSDRDHLLGILDILNNYRVKNILISGTYARSDFFAEFLNKAEDRGVNIIFANKQTDFILSGVKFDILSPQSSLLAREKEKENRQSIVVRVIKDGRNILFTGDTDKKGEEQILLSTSKLKSDVLKVAHHGSKTSSSEDFLLATRASDNIICAQKDNQFGHPHEEVVSRLLGKTHITANKGDIYLSFQENSFFIKP